MRAFTFNLEQVLNLKQFQENEAKVELGKAISNLQSIEQKLLILAEERAKAASDQFKSGNTASVIQQYMFYLLRLDAAKEQLVQDAALAEMKVEEARNAFIEAQKERKPLDKLKEKRLKEYRKEMLGEETKVVDDIRRQNG